MNLYPARKRFLSDNRYDALHWTHVGLPYAPDIFIMDWARKIGLIQFKFES